MANEKIIKKIRYNSVVYDVGIQTTATTSADGLMSAADKSKLDNISDDATSTTISATSPIARSAATGDVTISHVAVGPSATGNTSKGDTSNQTPAFGETFKVTAETVDKFGHTTALTEHTVQIPSTTASTTVAGLMSAADKSKLDGISEGAQPNSVTGVKGNSESSYRTGNVNITKANIGLGKVENKSSATIRGEITSSNVTTALGYTPATQNTATTTVNGLMSSADKAKLDGMLVSSIFGTDPIEASTSDSVTTISHKNSGVTANTYGTTATTALTPGFGSTFNVPGFTVDAKGHVTVAGSHTVKIPATVASTSAAGLLSASDKSKIDGGVGIAGNTVALGGSISADTLRISLGLSNAMHFIGIATVAITDGSTTNPTISGYTFGTNGASAQKGDVVIDKDSAYEFVWTGSKWERLGPDGSYALSGHSHNNATTSAAGFMSATDKSKLDGITVYTINGTNPISTSNSDGAVTITHDASGVTAASKGDTSNQTPGFGSTFKVTSGTVDTYGHMTAFADHTVKIPNTTASSSAAGLMSSGDKGKLDGVEIGAQVNVIESVKMNNTALTISSKAVNIPVMGAASSSAAGTAGVVPAPGSGKQESFLRGDGTWVVPTNTTYNNATTGAAGLMSATDKAKLDGITAEATKTTISATTPIIASASTGAVTLTHATSGPNSSADTSKGDTSAQTPTWGGTFKVTSGTVNKYGHTTAFADHTVKIPNSTATTSTAGLMSAADKSKLDGISATTSSVTVGDKTFEKYVHPSYTAKTSGLYKITVDGTGHVSATTAVTKADITGLGIPGSNTDTKVNVQTRGTTKSYLMADTTAPTSTAAAHTAVAETGIYMTTTAGELNATQYKINEAVTLQYNSTTKSLDFIFA